MHGFTRAALDCIDSASKIHDLLRLSELARRSELPADFGSEFRRAFNVIKRMITKHGELDKPDLLAKIVAGDWCPPPADGSPTHHSAARALAAEAFAAGVVHLAGGAGELPRDFAARLASTRNSIHRESASFVRAASVPRRRLRKQPGVTIRQWNGLNDKERGCLITLLHFRAYDAEHRRTAAEIAERLVGENSPSKVSRDLARLRRKRLVDSKGHRGGGSWLTEKGLALVTSRSKGTQQTQR